METTQKILLPKQDLANEEKPKLDSAERVGIVEAILFVSGNAVAQISTVQKARIFSFTL